MGQWPKHLLLAELLGKHIQKSPLRQRWSGLLVNVQRLANSTLQRQLSQVSNSDVHGSNILETGFGMPERLPMRHSKSISQMSGLRSNAMRSSKTT